MRPPQGLVETTPRRYRTGKAAEPSGFCLLMDQVSSLGPEKKSLREDRATSPRSVAVLVVSAAVELRALVRERLSGWRGGESRRGSGEMDRPEPDAGLTLREATSGADALEKLMDASCDVLLLDAALPDLRPGEFRELVGAEWPEVQILGLPVMGGVSGGEGAEPSWLLREIGEVLRGRGGEQGAIGQGADVALQAAGEGGRLRGAEVAAGAEGEEPILGAARGTGPRTEQGGGVGRARVGGGWQGMVGGSDAMQRVYRSVRLVARRDTSVLVEGESGTGKDLVAQAVHAASGRAKQPFVVINCAAIPEALLEAELFGYTKGAFTGAVQSRIGRIHAAHGGTLFLDEIGEMPLPLQSKLLRFLEQGEVQRIGGSDTLKVDVRVVAATNAGLKKLAGTGGFREDLYYRLAVFPIRLPPLRERMEDLPALVELFLERFAPGMRVSAGAWARLQGHSWPGNVRELRNVMERASLYAEGAPEIGAEDVEL